MGDVLGYVMGDDLDGDDLDGEDIDGDDLEGMATMGARRRRRHWRRHPHHHMMPLPPKPRWRRGEVAPGIQAPREGLELLTMTPDNGDGIVTVANQNNPILWTAKPQRPFRAERLIALIARGPDTTSGAVPTAFVTSDGIFVGTALQQLTRGGRFNLEMFSPTAFGVRMSLAPAAPGIDITLTTAVTGAALTGDQTIAVSLQFLGRSLAA